ncbi:MAG: hypothetical protein J6A37_14370 [Oscillospiraceae bacterium]|nr:hypothetical protein [Oscillospiraceae bacterium]
MQELLCKRKIVWYNSIDIKRETKERNHNTKHMKEVDRMNVYFDNMNKLMSDLFNITIKRETKERKEVLILTDWFGELRQQRHKALVTYRIFDDNEILIDSGNLTALSKSLPKDCLNGEVMSISETDRTMDIFIKRHSQA